MALDCGSSSGYRRQPCCWQSAPGLQYVRGTFSTRLGRNRFITAWLCCLKSWEWQCIEYTGLISNP